MENTTKAILVAVGISIATSTTVFAQGPEKQITFTQTGKAVVIEGSNDADLLHIQYSYTTWADFQVYSIGDWEKPLSVNVFCKGSTLIVKAQLAKFKMVDCGRGNGSQCLVLDWLIEEMQTFTFESDCQPYKTLLPIIIY